jgi:hypothetical protein
MCCTKATIFFGKTSITWRVISTLIKMRDQRAHLMLVYIQYIVVQNTVFIVDDKVYIVEFKMRDGDK